MENTKKRQKRNERAKQPLTEEQKAQRHLDRLKRNKKLWAKAAALRNVSKTPSLPFDESTHKIITECIKSVEEAKNLDQRTRNEDGSHQANVCVVCDEFIDGTQVLHWIEDSMLRSEDT